MPTLHIYVPDDVGRVLAKQARSLLLGRAQFARAILCAATEQIARQEAGNAEPDPADATANVDARPGAAT